MLFYTKKGAAALLGGGPFRSHAMRFRLPGMGQAVFLAVWCLVARRNNASIAMAKTTPTG